MDLLIILVLIFLNGILSMIEMSIASSRKSKLKSDANKNSKNTLKVIEANENPTKYFSTIQVGITLIGILTGLFGGQSFVPFFESIYSNISFIAGYANQIAVITVITIITMLTVILGELVPKQIGMTFPEKIATMFIVPMSFLATLFKPIVWLLTSITKMIIKLLRVDNIENQVTEEEIKSILKESLESGEIEQKEHDIIERVFSLDDLRVESIMTPLKQTILIYDDDTIDDIKNKLSEASHRIYPYISDEDNEVIGILRLENLLKYIFGVKSNAKLQLNKLVEKAIYVPETMTLHSVLEVMLKNRQSYVLIVDEFGQTQGIITQNDIFDALIEYELDESTVEHDGLFVREDGSILVDGQYPFFELLHALDREDLHDDTFDINTVAGLILEEIERIPEAGEIIEWQGYKFEIMDMDNQRIDKVLVTKEEEQVIIEE